MSSTSDFNTTENYTSYFSVPIYKFLKPDMSKDVFLSVISVNSNIRKEMKILSLISAVHVQTICTCVRTHLKQKVNSNFCFIYCKQIFSTSQSRNILFFSPNCLTVITLALPEKIFDFYASKPSAHKMSYHTISHGLIVKITYI